MGIKGIKEREKKKKKSSRTLVEVEILQPITKCPMLFNGSHYHYLEINGNIPRFLNKNCKEFLRANHTSIRIEI